ncbi:hypothetical protein [Butyrivibrio sp. AE3004]|uniref:hypothetical protein n=1 Tax=Butyrivibrio sp. AE3004 TaxID=1506994 RepID=UPI000493F88C|nr:hypothetical protein [Butyrivibrio sp. AE3004]
MNEFLRILQVIGEGIVLLVEVIYELLIMGDEYITSFISGLYRYIENYFTDKTWRSDRVSFHQGARHLYIVIRLFLFLSYIPITLPLFVIREIPNMDQMKEAAYKITRVAFYGALLWGMLAPSLFWGIHTNLIDTVLFDFFVGFNPWRACLAFLYYKADFELQPWLEIKLDDIVQDEEDDNEIEVYEEKGER